MSLKLRHKLFFPCAAVLPFSEKFSISFLHTANNCTLGKFRKVPGLTIKVLLENLFMTFSQYD